MALDISDFYDAALTEYKKSLKSCDTNLERFETLRVISETELNFSKDEKFKDYSQEHLSKSYEAINAALSLRPKVKEGDKSAEGVRLSHLLEDALIQRATCEVKLGKIDEALSTIDEARAVNKNANIGIVAINDITRALEDKNEYEKIISAVKKLSKWDRIAWLCWGPDEGSERFQHAAWICNKQAFMVQTFQDCIRWTDELGNDYYHEGARARLQLAMAYQTVFVNYQEARRLLYVILDGKKGGGTAASELVFVARLNLTNIVMEEFRKTTDSKEKSELYSEMRSLALRNYVALDDDFEPYGSQTAIPMGLMARKLGPALEFQKGMDKIFGKCVAALKDNDGWNDNPAFRLLAKTLAWVPGLEKDAQISISLQFSCVDKDVFKDKNELDDAPSGDQTTTSTESMTRAIAKEEGASADTKADKTAQGEEKKDPEPEEDLLEHQSITCNGCNKIFEDWKDGPLYLCTICTDTDLCTECHNKRVASNQSGKWTEWRTYCGPHHRYIKGPIAEFKGVKDGIVMIGEERFKFTDWLDGLSDKRWKDCWVDWWQKDDLVDDIL
jgi:tetratricopeptide (TPR) repeat protein